MTNVPIVPDFSKPKVAEEQPIRFTIDDDTFEAYPAIGGSLLMEAVGLDDLDQLVNLPTNEDDANALSTTQLAGMAKVANTQSKKMMTFLDEALLPASQARFAERMRSKGKDAIDMAQAFNVGRWLLQQYGARPTVPPSSSVNGHGGSGESSMAGAQPEG